MPKGTNSLTRSFINVCMCGRDGNIVSYYRGKKIGGIKEYKSFASYKDAIIFADKLKNKYNATDIKEKLSIDNSNKCYSVMPLSQVTDKMFIPVLINGKIISDEIISIINDGFECSYNIEVAKSGNMIVNDILSHNCIYSWNGANADNILKFEEHLVQLEPISCANSF